MNPSPILNLLLLVSFILTPTMNILLASNTVILNIHSTTDTMVFIDALYPDGFKNIGRVHVKGFGTIQLDTGSLWNAWRREQAVHGRFSPITIRLVAYNRYGLTDVKVIRIGGNNRVVNIYINDTRPSGVLLEQKGGSVTLTTVEPLVSAIRVLEDSYEWNKTVVLAMLNLDQSTFGTLHYAYLAHREMGFTVYLIDPDIQLAGWTAYSRDVGVELSTAASIGGRAYVWMTFRYRWEKWRVYGPGLPPEGYIEEYIYIKDFYPETAGAGVSLPANAGFTNIDSWNTSTYQATSSDLPYYQAIYGTLEYRYSSIDLTSFADLLLALGKITTSVWASIITVVSSIGVDFYIESVGSSVITVDLYSTIPGSYHDVSIGKDNIYVAGFNYFPVYYVKTIEK